MAHYNTAQRDILLKLLEQYAGKALSIGEILKLLEKTPDAPGKSTVYRLISSFEKEGLVLRHALSKGRGYAYTLSRDNCNEHLHLKCSSCQKIEHLGDDETKMIERNLSSVGFKLLSGSTTIVGICKQCQSDTERKKEQP